MPLKLYRWITLVFITFAMPSVSRAEEPFGFHFMTHRKQVQIPFQFRSNLIIIALRVNERVTAHFIVDTGVTYTIITDMTPFRNLPLTMSRTIALSGMGEGAPLKATVSIHNSITMGAVQTNNQTFVLLQEDVLHLSDYAGMPVHGIIGYELFANLVVAFDFQRQIMTLTQPDHYHYRPRKGHRCPLIIQDSKAYAEVLMAGSDNLPQFFRLLVDTGAGQALLLDQYQPSIRRPIAGCAIRVPLGRGLTGVINGQLGRIPYLSIGQYQLKDVLVAYPDSAHFNQKIASLFCRQGNIGCELLRRFVVTFHYGAGYMVLKPVKWVMRESFEHDMSGLELRLQGSQFNYYLIGQITPGSPADKAGLRVGDELLVINNQSAASLSLGDIYRLLTAGDGQPIDVFIRRANQLIHYHFLLKRLI